MSIREDTDKPNLTRDPKLQDKPRDYPEESSFSEESILCECIEPVSTQWGQGPDHLVRQGPGYHGYSGTTHLYSDRRGGDICAHLYQEHLRGWRVLLA